MTSQKPVVLHVLHGFGGGLSVAARTLARGLSEDFDHRFLHVRSPRRWFLEDASGATSRVSRTWWFGLERVSRRVDARLLHIHHLMGDHQSLLRALGKSSIPYVVTVHDFHLVCPRVHLVPPGEVYCGAPTDVSICRACLAQTPRRSDDPSRWRNRHREFLERARFVVVPSRYAGLILAKYWPDLPVRYVPHPYTPPEPLPAPRSTESSGTTVAVVGALSREKGGELLEQIAERACRRRLPVRFVMLGDTHRLGGPQTLYGGYLFVNGSYRREDLPGLLDAYQALFAMFPAIGPETFSLTLSEVLARGLPALVPDFGALAERVLETGAGWTVENWQDPDAWLDALMERLSDPQALARAGRAARNAAAGPGEADYEALYREALAL